MKTILIFGGSFDPIHYGHLNCAKKIQDQFNFDHFIFLPCKSQVLKESMLQTQAIHRLHMLELALNEIPSYPFEISFAEIKRDTPSYTVLSLEFFRKYYGTNASITLLMGEDAFSDITRWYQWEKIMNLANILCINRPHVAAEKTRINPGLVQHITKNTSEIKEHSHGVIAYFDAGTYDFSSTNIRKRLSEKKSVENELPLSVLDYIQKYHLYV